MSVGKLGGYHGFSLRLDATTGLASRNALPESVLRSFLGGVGLGTWILAHEMEAGLDALGPGSALVFALSPLVGTPLTTSAKFAVVGMSPLTGRICDALSSSHFAIAAKRTGVDAIVIKGASASPVVLKIDGAGESDGPVVTWEPAEHLWGLTASEAEARTKASLGPEWQIASIGPAGERLIPFATISHDGRHAGRGGLGAILGSKKIKAIAVRGSHRTQIANLEATIVLARDLSARSLGPTTEKYRELGTIANLLVFNRFNTLPTRNFQQGHFESAEALLTVDLTPARRLARNSCAACTIGCEHVFAKKKGEGGVRLEYESMFALGPLCGVDDPDVVIEASSRCDDHGIDTISTGGSIAFLMDAAERGWISIPWLRFGQGEAVLRAIDLLATREGKVGRLLAMGTRAAAAELGGDAPGIAMHVKGLEMPGYDPRKMQAMAVGLAVGTRGADHNRSGAYEADFRSQSDRSPETLTLAALETENRAALMDSMILCKFVRGVFNDLYEESAQMLASVTGWDVTSQELIETVVRIVNARKLVNQREGWTRDEDTLPSSLLDTPNGLSTPTLNSMIETYYQARWWNLDGRVPDRLRTALGLTSPAFGCMGAR